MSFSNLLVDNIEDSIKLKKKLVADLSQLKNFNLIINKILKSYKKNGKIFIIGNGGSAADAQHFACELVSKYKKNRKSINAICLNSNTSILTSIANDFDYKYVFSRQLESSISKKDILFAISTSGNSSNIIEALKYTKKNNIFSFLLSGLDGGKAKKYADSSILVPSKVTSTIQEVHLTIEHSICEIIENNIGR